MAAVGLQCPECYSDVCCCCFSSLCSSVDAENFFTPVAPVLSDAVGSTLSVLVCILLVIVRTRLLPSVFIIKNTFIFSRVLDCLVSEDLISRDFTRVPICLCIWLLLPCICSMECRVMEFIASVC